MTYLFKDSQSEEPEEMVCKNVLKESPKSTSFSSVASHHECEAIDKYRKHFVKFFFDTSFYLCVIPYKIVGNAGESEICQYRTRKFLPQQIICAILHFTAWWGLITSFRQIDLSRIENQPKLYFEVFTSLIHASVVISFTYTMWRKGNLICKLIYIVQKCPIVSLWFSKRITWALSFLTVLFMTMALLCPIFISDSKTWEIWYMKLVSDGRRSLFLTSGKNMTTKNYNMASTPTSYQYFLFPDFLFFLISYILTTTQWIFISQFTLVMLNMSLTLCCATNCFINRLKGNQNCKMALINYEALKSLSNTINGISGSITLTYTADCIMYYALHMNTLFFGGQWFSTITFIIFFCTSVAWLNFASYACLLMDGFRDWLRQKDNRTLLPKQSIAIILLIDEVSSGVVGISGHGLFTVNYKFVAQAITTLMTYFIIVIQFK